MVKIDSSGKVLQEIKSKGTRDWDVSNLEYYHDKEGNGRYAFGSAVWEVDKIKKRYVTQNRFIIMDTFGEVIKEIKFGNKISEFNGINKIKKIDGGFIIGYEKNGDGGEYKVVKIGIAKLDNEGNFIWKEEFPIAWKENVTPSWRNELTGLEIMQSGSILATGNGYSSKNEYCSFLIKLDKDGCLEAGCRNVAVEGIDITPIFSVFPNPSDGNITIHAREKGELVIKDVNGRSIYMASLSLGENEINPSLTPGMYFFHHLSQNKSKIIKVALY